MKKFFKVIFILAGSVLLAVFAAPVFMDVLNSGNMCGLLIGLLLLMYGIFFEHINRFVKKARKKPVGAAVLAVTALLVLAAIAFSAVVTVDMVRAANNPPQEETTFVVLGCRVLPEGPGMMLEERLRAAKKVLEENPDAKCILSGGQGETEPVSEAECMKDWLVTRGIDPERLYMEDKSTSTRENLEFSMEIVKTEGLVPHITLVTNEFHHYRANKVAKDLGVECCNISAKTQPLLLPTYYVRELLGALFDLVFGY